MKQVTFSKKQINYLKEGADNDDIYVRDDGNPQDMAADASKALSQNPKANGATFNASSLERDNKPAIDLKVPIKNPSDINKAMNTIDPKIVNALKNSGDNNTITFEKEKTNENIIRYTKKELNKILFS